MSRIFAGFPSMVVGGASGHALALFVTGSLLVACGSGEAGHKSATVEAEKVAESAAALHSAPESGCTAATFQGHEYWFCGTNRNAASAKSVCSAAGMTLARIDGQAENDFLSANISWDSWIGADDIATEGAFKWQNNGDTFWSGSAVGGRFTNWSFFEPDDGGNQDCVDIEWLTDGLWSTRSCSDTYGFVCEAVMTPADRGVECAGAGPAGAPWPSFRGCATGQARSKAFGAPTPEAITSFPTGDDIESSPAVGADGTIYVGSNDGNLYAVRPDGTQRWRYPTGGRVRSSPALGVDGTIYVGSDDDYLHAVFPDGNRRWRFPALGDVRSSPRVAADGTIYVGSDNTRVYAVRPDGTKRWEFKAGKAVRSSAAVAPGGTIYIGSEDGKLYALNPDGTKKWDYTALSGVTGSPAIGPDGTVYFTSFDGHVRALNPNSGVLKFAYFAFSPFTTSPAIAPDGSIVVGDNLGFVHALTSSGTERWEFPTNGLVFSSAAIGADNVAYIGATDGRLYAIDVATGTQRWTVPTGGEVDSSPAIGANGTVYVGSLDNRLYSIGGGPEPRVTCVSKASTNRYVALFGYVNGLPTPVTVPLGTGNVLSPVPSDPSLRPITTFQPGTQPQGFWIPFAPASQVSWTLRGRTVTASATSTACSNAAYSQPAGPVLIGDGPSNPAPNLPKLAPYFIDAAHSSSTMSSPTFMTGSGITSSTSNGISVKQQALTQPFPFSVQITDFITRGNGGPIDNFRPAVRAFIDDVLIGTVRMDIPQRPVLAQFDRAIPITQDTVKVRIQGIEIDDVGADDNEVTVDLVVDNRTGAWTGTVNSPTRCFTASNGWGVCWKIIQNGMPANLPSPQVCATWNADFVDGQKGEDFIGVPAPNGAKHRLYPASFAEFSLDIQAVRGKFHFGATYDASGNPTTGSQPAFLDKDGCVPAGVIPGDAMVFLDGTPAGAVDRGGLEIDLRYRPEFQRCDDPNGCATSTALARKYHVSDVVARTATTLTLAIPTFRASASAGDFGLSAFTTMGGFAVPPSKLLATTTAITPVTHVGAIVSRMLTADDTGMPAGDYLVRVHDGCDFNGQQNSCFDPPSQVLKVGGAVEVPGALPCTTSADCEGVQECRQMANGTNTCHWPEQSRWKYITAHEAGHQVQHRTMGTLGGSYTFSCPQNSSCPGKREGTGAPSPSDPLVDPPFADDLCGCQHVTAANAQHCLQSIEVGPKGHSEGYAQFFASKTWNVQTQNDCTFVYYKDFLLPENQACPPGAVCQTFASSTRGPLQKVLPPIAVTCALPTNLPTSPITSWRNNFCPVSDAANMVTELDILGFLWNINTASSSVVTRMPDLFAVYRKACHPDDANPGVCDFSDMAWEPERDASGNLTRPGFREGAERFYGPDSPRFDHILVQGKRFGVTPALQ
jgi:outer membrane protein assembly factor BamB